MWDFMAQFASTIAKLQETQAMPHYKTVRRSIAQSEPPIELLQVQRNIATGVEQVHRGLTCMKPDPEGVETIFAEAKLKVMYSS
jgi:hypothetical protein